MIPHKFIQEGTDRYNTSAHKSAKIKKFCFDAPFAAEHKARIGFLMHDNDLYDGVDSR
ncbi:hypothetical protein S1OALGB6SA_1952 [Olavius algarvensis spirochete endosymbiont]|nr:MAG: hypothetical protein [Olavius algarvensis spirochete endosymbiont]VDB00862.1 hypothetical protein S1OALGB6SA_1952 [Olavius algarvensis spirochete endosymbiont]